MQLRVGIGRVINFLEDEVSPVVPTEQRCSMNLNF
jgi:hypothetical protein